MIRRSLADPPAKPKNALAPGRDNLGQRVQLLTKHKFLLAIARDKNLASSAKAVAAVLLEYFNDDPKSKNPGWAWPSLSNLAKATELPRRTVVDAVRKLVEQGHFERQSGDRHHSNRYRPCWERSPRVEGHPRAENHPTLERSTAPPGRADHRPVLPSKTPRQRYPSKQQGDACAQGKKEKGQPNGNPITTLTLEAVVADLQTNRPLKSDHGFALFLSLWPIADGNRDLLRGAWLNQVAKSKADVRVVLMAALIWNRFANLFPEEFVPKPGRWLKERGWRSRLPYQCDKATIEAFEEAFEFGSPNLVLRTLDDVATEHLTSPFREVWEKDSWPDRDREIARNAFNGVLARGHSIATVVTKVERMVSKRRNEGEDLPLLGKWLSEKFPGAPSVALGD